MTDQDRTSASDVFINCPFDDDYRPIFDAIQFTVIACEFTPRSALELEDGSQTRIDKLYSIIEVCRYGVHDLSRTELDPSFSLPRFNMPLELGIFLGAKRYGADGQGQKRCLILDVERYRYQKFISDLAGMDIKAHDGEAARAITCVRNWLASVSRRSLPGATLIQAEYSKFLGSKRDAAGALGLDAADIPYSDYQRMVTAWLLEASGAPRKPRKRKAKD